MPEPRPPSRSPWVVLPIAGAVLGVVILGVRVMTLPASALQPFYLGVVAALGLTAAIVAGRALTIRNRMRAAAAAYPDALLIPVVVGTATAVATRWLAAHTGDPALRLPPSTYAAVAVDAAGLHVVRSGAGSHGHLPARSVELGPLGRTVAGMREVDALVLEVTVGSATAPLALVPMRLRGNPLRGLTDAELLDVSARIEDALAGRAIAPGWGY